jgi:hypothetical protein
VRRRRPSSRHTRLIQPTLIGMEEKGERHRRTSVPRGPFIGLFFRLCGFARTWQLFMIIFGSALLLERHAGLGRVGFDRDDNVRSADARSDRIVLVFLRYSVGR